MSQYEQMKKDFPTMYLRVMRNDAKVRCVAAEPAAEGQFLRDFAELAEEAGLQDVADELREAAAEVKPRAPRKPSKSRAKKNDPDNFPM